MRLFLRRRSQLFLENRRIEVRTDRMKKYNKIDKSGLIYQHRIYQFYIKTI